MSNFPASGCVAIHFPPLRTMTWPYRSPALASSYPFESTCQSNVIKNIVTSALRLLRIYKIHVTLVIASDKEGDRTRRSFRHGTREHKRGRRPHLVNSVRRQQGQPRKERELRGGTPRRDPDDPLRKEAARTQGKIPADALRRACGCRLCAN